MIALRISTRCGGDKGCRPFPLSPLAGSILDNVPAGTTEHHFPAQFADELESVTPYRVPRLFMTLFPKRTYFGHKPFGFQSLPFVIHGCDVS